jgi:hypothetical protein
LRLRLGVPFVVIGVHASWSSLVVSSIVDSGSTHLLTYSIFKYPINTMLLIKLEYKIE